MATVALAIIPAGLGEHSDVASKLSFVELVKCVSCPYLSVSITDIASASRNQEKGERMICLVFPTSHTTGCFRDTFISEVVSKIDSVILYLRKKYDI